MSAEANTTEAPQNGNAAAEQDVQNLLAELKGDEEKKPENGTEAAEEDEAAEEARIIAEAAKLGEEQAAQESKGGKRPERSNRRDYRENIKFDPTSQGETDDHDEIRKQVCAEILV